MPTPYETFMINISNALQLIDIAKNVADPNSQQLLFRSAIVLSVAHWQNFNEEVIGQYSSMIQKRSKASTNLSNIVRDEIGKWIYAKEAIKDNPQKSQKLIWEYANGIWKKHYGEFAQEKIGQLNTPNTKNLVVLYKAILGIENISTIWANKITSYSPSIALDTVLNKRHEIAHGRSFIGNLSQDKVEEYINHLNEIAEVSYSIVTIETAKILESCGEPYSLDTFQLKGLIKWLAELPEPRTFDAHDLSSINTTWFGNHRKLSHTDWPLLEGPAKIRVTTEKFKDFIEGKTSLPYEIISFDGKNSIPKPGTAMIYFKDL